MSTTGFCDTYEQMIEQAAFLVVLHRRNNDIGEPLYGIHAISRRPLAERTTRHGEFMSRTIGLFGAEKMEELTAYAVKTQHFAQYGLVEVEHVDLHNYIGDQIIPVEWKQEYHNMDPFIFGRISVYA